jgi:hypothetical protein
MEKTTPKPTDTSAKIKSRVAIFSSASLYTSEQQKRIKIGDGSIFPNLELIKKREPSPFLGTGLVPGYAKKI